jgi:DNA polymerase II large subunit
MRLSDVHPKKDYNYIFVQFPGMKMNVPMLSSGEGEAVKEDAALCVQLDHKEKVHQLYFVRTQSIKPFDFTDEGIGAKASYRVIKQKENSQDSHTNVTVITDEVEIVQKQTKTGYNFVLVVNKREIGIVASMEEEVLQPVNGSVQLKEQAIEGVSVKAINKDKEAVFRRNAKKKIFSGGEVFQDIVVIKQIRILLEGVKRKVTVFSPAALDFIGPGDQNHTTLIMRRCE